MGVAKLRAVLAFLLAWPLLAAILVAPIMVPEFPYLRSIERIRENPATAAGVFTAKDCVNHASNNYVFDVDRKTYRGGGGLPSSGGGCNDIRIGATVTVHYDRGDPSSNSGREPNAALRNAHFHAFGRSSLSTGRYLAVPEVAATRDAAVLGLEMKSKADFLYTS